MTRLFVTLFLALAIAVSYISMAHANAPRASAAAGQTGTNSQQLEAIRKLGLTKNPEAQTGAPAAKSSTSDSEGATSTETERDTYQVTKGGKPHEVKVIVTERKTAKGLVYSAKLTAQEMGCAECKAHQVDKTGSLTDVLGPQAANNLLTVEAIMKAYEEQSGFNQTSSSTAEKTATDPEKAQALEIARKEDEKVKACEIWSYAGNPPVEKRFNDKNDPTARLECYAKRIRELRPVSGKDSAEKDRTDLALVNRMVQKVKASYFRLDPKSENADTLIEAFNKVLDAMDESNFDSIPPKAAEIRTAILDQQKKRVEADQLAIEDKFLQERANGDTAEMDRQTQAYARTLTEFRNVTRDLRTSAVDFKAAKDEFASNTHSGSTNFSPNSYDSLDFDFQKIMHPAAELADANAALRVMTEQRDIVARNRQQANNQRGNQQLNTYGEFTSKLLAGSSQANGAGNNVTSAGSTAYNRPDSLGNATYPRVAQGYSANYSMVPPLINFVSPNANNWQRATAGSGFMAANSTPAANFGPFANQGNQFNQQNQSQQQNQYLGNQSGQATQGTAVRMIIPGRNG